MKTMSYTACLGSLILLVLPLSYDVYAAVPPPGDDLFGLYADDNFNDDASDENPTFVYGVGEIQVYVYLTNVSAQAVGAYEFGLSFTGQGQAPIWLYDDLPPGGLNFFTHPEYIVGLAEPLFPNGYGHAILMVQHYIAVDSDPVYVTVIPISVPSVPDQISYVDYFDVNTILPMYSASGNFEDPIFAFNTGLIATESSTWSGVKSLYR
jgi:hypothetical protein